MNVMQKEALGLPPMELAEKRPNASAQRVSAMGTLSRKLFTILGTTFFKMFCIVCCAFIGAIVLVKCLPQNDRVHTLKTNVIIYSNAQKSINVTKGTSTKDDLEVVYEIRDNEGNSSSIAAMKSRRSILNKIHNTEAKSTNGQDDNLESSINKKSFILVDEKSPKSDEANKIGKYIRSKIETFVEESKVGPANAEVLARKPRAAEYDGSMNELDSGDYLENQRYPVTRYQLPFNAQPRSQHEEFRDSSELNGKSEISFRDKSHATIARDYEPNFNYGNMMFGPHMHQGECLYPKSPIQNNMQASGQFSSYDNQFIYNPYPFPANPFYNPNYPPNFPYSQPGFTSQYNQGFFNSRMNQQTWPVTAQSDPGTAFEQVRHPQDVGITMQHFGVMPTSSTSMASESIESTESTQPTHSSARSFCSIDSRTCSNGDTCIDQNQWCDGHVDCTDSSDEASCPCRTRVGERICDGYYDCPFGEDEMGCYGCNKDEFSCDDVDLDSKSSCFLKSQRCDGKFDCPNRKDEIECNMLAPSLHEKPIYAISHSEGFLHRNYEGKWYPVCQNPYMWAHEACVRETGLLFEPPAIQRREIDPFFRGEFINNVHGDSIQLTARCFNHSSVYVTCQDLMCGTRVQSTVQSLRENIDVENHMFGRLKREISQYQFGSQAFPNMLLPPMPKYPLITPTYKRASRQYPNDMYYRYDLLGPAAMKAKRAEERVVGGQASLPGAWPWMVAIFRDGAFTCGGVVINKRWIVSAAHCVHNFWDHYYEVQVGMLRRYSFSPQEQNHKVTHVIVNQRYNRAEMSNDLSLLRVSPSIQFSRWVRPVCLPSPSTAGPEWIYAPPPGVTCTAVGWGATQEKPARAKFESIMDPDHMREVDVPIWNICKHGEDIRGNEVCAGVLEGGKDACQGDSGGPLLCKNPLNAKQWYLAGIVSHGDGCGRKGEPGVYTRVSLFVEWIHFTLAAPHLPGLKPRQDCPGFRCVSGTTKCLPKERKCDRRVDCLDGEDEVSCAYENFELDLLATTKNFNNETQLQPTNTGESTELSEEKSKTENITTTTSTEIVISKNRTESHFHEDTEDLLTTPVPIPTSSESSNNFVIALKNATLNTTTANKVFNNGDITNEKKTIKITDYVTRNPKVFIEEEDSTYMNVSNEIKKSESNKTTAHDTIFTSTETVPTEITYKTITDIDKENKEIIDDSSNITDNPEIEDKNKGTTTDPNQYQTQEDSKELPTSTTERTADKPEDKGLPVESTTHRSLPITTVSPENGNILPAHTTPDIKDKPLGPSVFQCWRIRQTIPYSHRCNHHADCEDGTDELECSCVDYITTFNRKLLCDGFSDCPDASDEANCFVCESDQYLCKWSRTCIPLKHVCDRTVHCPYAEDELDCSALTNGQFISFDMDGKPEVNIKGYLTTRHPGGTWHVVCEDVIDIEDQEKAATNVCRSMGFSGYREYKVKHIKMTDVIQRTIRNHDGTRQRIHFVYRSDDDDSDFDDEEEEEKIIKDPVDVPPSCVNDNDKKTCLTLYVVCAPVLNSEISSHKMMLPTQKKSASEATNSSNLPEQKSDYIWPWAAKVYVEGEYRCTGILIDLSWVLINNACLWNTIVNKDYVCVILGSKRSESPTSGPFEQTIEIDDKDEIYDSKVTLLRLRNPAKLSRTVKPMVVPSSTLQRGDSAICVTVGRDANNRTATILLDEVHSDCGRNERCFVRHNLNKTCPGDLSDDGLAWAGIVACRAEQGGGWYPAASYMEQQGICGFKGHLSATSLLTLRTDLNDTMAKKSLHDPEWEAPQCAGVRCGRGRCVPLLRVCDHVNDCEDGRDEDIDACESKQRYCAHDPFDSECTCNSGQMKCKNGLCIAKQQFGDGEDDCGDASDEPAVATCAHYLARVTPHRLCDGKLHCLDRSDEDPNICKCFSERNYECSRSDTCVATDLVCDGVRDCPHGEDEASCIGLVAPTGTPYGTGEVIERRFGVWHTKCYRKANHTRSELEQICRDLGFIGGHARLLRSDPKPSVNPHTNVDLDKFYNITLNERTSFMLRSNENPMARAVVDDKAERCYPVFIECL